MTDDTALAASAPDEESPEFWEINGKRYGVPNLGPAPGEMSDLGVAYVELQRRFIAFADEVAAALAARRPAAPALDVETLAEAIHEASGTHSKTPTRMICDNPSWDGHRVFAARILARLSSEGHTE